MRRNRQNDMLEQCVMNWAVKDEFLGSILSCDNQKVFFHLYLSLLYRISCPVCLIDNQFLNKSRHLFNKA